MYVGDNSGVSSVRPIGVYRYISLGLTVHAASAVGYEFRCFTYHRVSTRENVWRE